MQSIVPSEKNTQQTQLQTFLETIAWNNTSFTENQLKTMLGVACLRYLGGLTEIEFVLELSEVIREKHYQELTSQFQETTDTLHNLAESLQIKDMELTGTKTLMNIIVQRIQKDLTGIPFVSN